MKKHFAIIATALLSVIFSLNVGAVKAVTPGIEEWASFLGSLGYNLYSFDTTDLSETQRTITVTIREYSGDSIVNENILGPVAYGFKVRTMLDDMPENVREDFRPDMEEPEIGLLKRIRHINIGLHRTPGDSTASCSYEIGNHSSFGPITLKLKPVSSPMFSDGKATYLYASRPFKMPEALPESGFVPLVLYSSFWVDKMGIIRSCGEIEISGLETSDIVKNSPHYFVIGFTII